MTKRLMVFFGIAIAAVVFAHEDPLGDVDPIVKVENGNFAIYFSNNTRQETAADYDMSGSSTVYRMVYSPTGELLGPRTASKKVRSDALWQEQSMVYDKKIQLSNETILFDAELLKKGKPSYLTVRNGVTEHRRLPWPDDVTIRDVVSAVVDEKSVTMSVTTGDSSLLTLFHFDRAKFQPPSVATVGISTYIQSIVYSFPSASNLIFADNRYWLAWIRYNPEKQKDETVLSGWVPGEPKPHETILDAPSDWNTSLSIAATGTHLCAAYHCSITGEYPGYSQLITVFKDMKEIP